MELGGVQLGGVYGGRGRGTARRSIRIMGGGYS